MNTFERNLEKYAELAVKVGINIQEQQTLVINAPISTADFIRKVSKVAYAAGAKNVHVEWSDEELTLIKYKQAPSEAFKDFPIWKAKGHEEMADQGAAFLTVSASNPDLLKGVDPERIATASKTAGAAMENFRKYIQSDKVSWTVLAVPTIEWASKLFPDSSDEEKVSQLWDLIFKATRVDLDDPVEAWKEHSAHLQSKVAFLNSKGYKKLHYKATGTDLTIELPEKHLWIGGSGENENGTSFVANIPTEEVFTVPKRDGVHGVVTSTKPLNYGGNLIENFSLTFENGKIVDFTAENGYETLKRLIEIDEGSHYLGEVALVPHNSPISNTNVIFYNTLFDENASNHLAIGSAYSFCIEGGKTMSKDDLQKNGANTSLTHVDFMIGSSEMDIDGELPDGKIEPLFRNGNWVV
jgi:aminopeptidase